MVKVSVIALSLLLAASFLSYGMENGVTPYGDFCPQCSKYGVCKKPLTDTESHKAMKAYFKEMGLEVGKAEGRGRFIRVEIMRGGKVADVVIFDKKTGRLRSIY